MLKNKNQSAFTIVELLIVIVVIAILAALTVVAYNGIQDRAETSKMKSELSNAAKTLQLDKASTGNFPADLNSANDGKGLVASSGTNFQYTVDNSVNPASFCLSAVNKKYAAHVTQTGSPADNVCSGHIGPASSGQPVATCDTTSRNLGDTGPGGGKIFYDKGSCSDGWRYMEYAGLYGIGAPNTNLPWCSDATTLLGATGTAIGTGKSNTDKMMTGCSSGAAKIATSYSGGGKTDWFLPSKDELNQIYVYSRPGGDNDGWSSSEVSATKAWFQVMTTFGGGTQSTQSKTSSSQNVYPVRRF